MSAPLSVGPGRGNAQPGHMISPTISATVAEVTAAEMTLAEKTIIMKKVEATVPRRKKIVKMPKVNPKSAVKSILRKVSKIVKQVTIMLEKVAKMA